METVAHLEKLPEGFEFPESCRDKVHYDLGKRQIVFRGHMTLHDYQVLIAAHRDVEYLRAIETIFRNCDTPPRQRAPMLFWGLVVIIVLATLMTFFYREWK